MSGSINVGGSKCDKKCPQVNWLQHANSHDNFSNQNKFLSSNFLFSLPTQKPRSEGTIDARSMGCHMQNIGRLQRPLVEKAWQTLSSFQLSQRNYFKPGKSIPLGKDASIVQDVRKHATLESLNDKTGKPLKNIERHQILGESYGQIDDTGSFIAPSFPMSRSAKAGKTLEGQIWSKVSMLQSSCSKVVDRPSGDHFTFTREIKGQANTTTDGLSDDDILGNIDVDQIVMDHYHSASTLNHQFQSFRQFLHLCLVIAQIGIVRATYHRIYARTAVMDVS
ncbi:hypothetical protein Nepgr_025772 [Nepenthes gracilis]|uniref:Uncharacterized protein n=1 Tax=Nepenthes gracilis TaxID=150966 RepID=A0AAD3T7N5_NEPGR|nr:hypothetical protein Nepgr_025772 [Nepenthes gracilis]